MSLGPGNRSHMVPRALEALLAAEVIVGYKTYLGIIQDILEGKKVLSSGMRKEVDRCRDAIDEALAGRRVAIVSSGDAGIYGMAGLVFDVCRGLNLRVRGANWRDNGVQNGSGANSSEVDLLVEVIPGVPAFNSAASILGAPLMHDFAAVSLSDHLTPWELIEKRLAAVAEADFVIAIYNPRSKTRPDLLKNAQGMLLQFRSPDTPVGIVRQAMRAGEWRRLTTLGDIPFEEVDMQSIVIVGNSRTYIWGDWMATPRGYLDKYEL